MAMQLAIDRDNFWSAWDQLLSALVDRGEERSPRGMATKEFLGVQFTVRNSELNILYHPLRDLNYKFMVAEWLWIMSGSEELDLIGQYNSQMKKFSDDGLKLSGAYGPRLIPQVPWLINKLKESDTRQAIAMIWTPTPATSKDIPCTIALQFLRRDDAVNLIVTMRSSDIWLGLPYDFYVFTQVLNCICGELECKMGWTQFHLGSSHLYLDYLEKARGLLKEYIKGSVIASPGAPGMPPRDFLDDFKSSILDSTYTGIWETYRQVLISPRKDALKLLTSRS